MSFQMGVPPMSFGAKDVVSLDLEVVGQQLPLHIPSGEMAICSVSTVQGSWLMTEVKEVRKFLARAKKAKIAMHNALYDCRQLEKWGIDTSGLRLWDTMLVDRMVYGGYYNQFDLSALTRRYLRQYMSKDVRDEFGNMEKSGITSAHLEYAALDATSTRDIALLQMEQIEDEEDRNYWLIEEPTIHAVLNMPGPRIDKDSWLVMVAGFERESERIKKELGFNFRSPTQTKDMIEKRLKVKLKNTRNETLVPYQDDELVGLILEGREFATLASTYGSRWIDAHVQADGTVSPNWSVIGADTDRMSCSEPNMQNIPVRKHPEYRACIVARPGHKIVSMDAVGQELRCMIAVSKDENMLGMIQRGEDPYVETAVKAMGAKDRKAGKTVVLGLDYGMSEFGLAKRLGVTEEKAQQYIAGFFRLFPGIHSYLREQRSKAMSLGYVRDTMGGKTWVNLYGKQWPNNAVNAPVQRTAALLTKKALSLQYEKSLEAGLPFYTTMVVHDETVGDVPKKEEKKYVKIARQSWIEAASIVIPNVPFEVDWASGENWACKH